MLPECFLFYETVLNSKLNIGIRLSFYDAQRSGDSEGHQRKHDVFIMIIIIRPELESVCSCVCSLYINFAFI